MTEIIKAVIKTRGLVFFLFNIAALIFLYPLLRALVLGSFENETYSHIVLIPFVSAFFLYSSRRAISLQARWGPWAGAALIGSGALIYAAGAGLNGTLTPNGALTVPAFAAVVIWIGGFTAVYGRAAAKSSLFPLLFLFLMVPLPDFILKKAVYVLQSGSAWVSELLFRASGTPFQREPDFVFRFPAISIMVAEECSGIRSSLSLFVVSLVAGQLFLKSALRKTVFCAAVLPLSIIKNGMRIVTLTLVGIYIDPGALNGPLHTRGGIPFFLLALAVAGLILFLLKRGEKKAPQR